MAADRPQPGSSVTPVQPPPRSALARWAIGTSLAYFGLHTLPFPLDQLPWQHGGAALAEVPRALEQFAAWQQQAVTWFGEGVLRLATVLPGGGADSLFEHVRAGLLLTVATLLGLLLAAADWRGRSLPSWHALVRTQLRYAIAAMLLTRGFPQLVERPTDTLAGARLYDTLGDTLPAGLRHACLAVAPGHAAFLGSVAILAGLLLLFRRTTLLGAVLTLVLAVAGTAEAYGYDLPTKLPNLHLVTAASLLAAVDRHRLLAVFWSHRATPATLPPARPGWLRATVLLPKLALAGWLVWQPAATAWQGRQPPTAEQTELHGIWEVTEFSWSATTGQAPAATTAWHHLVVTTPAGSQVLAAEIGYLGQPAMRTGLTVDRPNRTLHFQAAGHPDAGFALQFELRQPNAAAGSRRELLLDGSLDGRPLHAVLTSRNPAEFPLHRRGFQQIQSAWPPAVR